MPQFSRACLLLVTLWLTIAFPVWAETRTDERPPLVVTVYNDAGVSATVLVQAEQEAAKIFDRAGLDVIWQECSTSHVGPDALVRAAAQSAASQGGDGRPCPSAKTTYAVGCR